ncbi:MAG TPA: GNAT family N-acetyltransferase [Thermoleophilaceae bacterium]
MLDRIREFLRTAENAVCDEARVIDVGTALLTPSLPLVWSLNALRVEDPDADAERLEATAEQYLSAYGHRRLVMHDQQLAARLAPELAARGWNVDRLLVMVSRRPAQRLLPDGLAAEADRELGAAALAAFRREQPFGWQDEAVRQLGEMDARFSTRMAARDFVAPAGRPTAACRLYSDGRTAQVDEVGTLETARGRGLGSAVVLAAVAAAGASGHDLVFLVTNAGDWPQELYRRLGFDDIGSVYEFLKLPLGASR